MDEQAFQPQSGIRRRLQLRLSTLCALAILLATFSVSSAQELRRLPLTTDARPLNNPLRDGSRPEVTVYPEQQAGYSQPEKPEEGEIQLVSVRQPTFSPARAPENLVRFSPSSTAYYQQSDEEPAERGGGSPEPVEPGSREGSDERPAGEQPKTIGRAPVDNSMQFLRSESVLLKPGKWQADTGIAYTLFENTFPLGIVDELNNNEIIGVVESSLRQRLLYTPLAVRYGWCENIQLFASMPIGWSNTQNSLILQTDEGAVGINSVINSGGLGDLVAGATMLLWTGEELCPTVISTWGVTMPTGKFTTPILGQVPGSSLGQGFWAFQSQLLAIHAYDPITVFYGVGYRHLFEREFNGIPFQPGEQINYQLGVGFSVNDRITLSTALQGYYITDIVENNEHIEGTNLEPYSLRFAATIMRCERIVEPFAQIGMTPSAPSVSVGVTITCY